MADLTIAIVVRNAIDDVTKTVASIARQNTRDYRVVLVDGDSSDFTRTQCALIATQCDWMYISEPDKGVYDAMNKAASLAETPYILYLNAGDTLYRPDSLQHLINAITAYNGQPDFIAGSYCYVTVQGHEKVTHLRQDPRISWTMIENGRFNNRYNGGVPLHNATVIRTALVREYPYNGEEYPISADLEQMLRCWRFGHRNWTIAPIVVCRFFAGGLSTIRRLTVLKNMLDIFRKATCDKPAVKKYLRSALYSELTMEAKSRFKWKYLWPIIKEWPVSTLRWFMLPKKDSKINPRIVNIINLSTDVDAFRDIYNKVKDKTKRVNLFANQHTQNAVKATVDSIPVANLDSVFNSPREFYGQVILVVDNLSFTPGLLDNLRQCGICRPCYYLNGLLQKGKLAKQRVIGLSATGDKIYKTN